MGGIAQGGTAHGNSSRYLVACLNHDPFIAVNRCCAAQQGLKGPSDSRGPAREGADGIVVESGKLCNEPF